MGTPSRAKEPGENLLKELEKTQALLKASEARHVEEMVKFAYSIAHDLREPMRIVLSFTDLLSRRYESRLDDEGRELMGFISDAGQRMERFVSDLLNYSRQLRTADKPPTAVGSEAALRSAMVRFETQVADNGAQITYDKLPEVQSDYESLAEVFGQMISNSLLFRGKEAPRIHVGVEQADGEATFIVRDNGVGIDPTYSEQIFEPFRRLHGRRYPGNGLGLAICRRIVERSGGRIWLESGTGGGSEFRFTVPT